MTGTTGLVTERARRKPPGFSPGGEADFRGFSLCASLLVVI
jgi:hypothetical protein